MLPLTGQLFLSKSGDTGPYAKTLRILSRLPRYLTQGTASAGTVLSCRLDIAVPVDEEHHLPKGNPSSLVPGSNVQRRKELGHSPYMPLTTSSSPKTRVCR